MLLCRSRFAARVLPVCVLFFAFPLMSGAQQAPVALPYTMTTLAGSSPMAGTAGTQCPNLPTGVKSVDTSGDGCLAVNSVLGAAGRGGVQVDSFGNVFIADDINNIIHQINPTTGIMSVLAGGGTACSGKLDSTGDGCLAATQTVTSGQRGIGIDPYGNIFLPGYGDHLAHVVCRTTSPLCTPAQVGYMELVAGCAASTGASGTTGAGLDNTPGFSTNGNSSAAFNNHGTCTTSLGETDTPRGITADVYGNVYYADTATYRFRVVVGPQTSTYFTGTNPIYAALGVHYASVTQGYVYTVVDIGGTTAPATTAATVKGAACSETVNAVVYSGTALDTYGDGCPLDFSSVSDVSTSYVQGTAVDAVGNMIFTDPSHGLRVFFVSGAGTAGAAMQAAITFNNPGVTPQAGFIYMLAGAGTLGTTGAVSATPQLGNSRTALDTTIFRVTVSPHGDIYIADGTKVLFFDINTGYIRTLLTAGGANIAAGAFCSGTSGQKSLSAYSDGCPASASLFTNSNGLSAAVDGQGNVYLYDEAAGASAPMLVRKVLAQGFASQTVGTPLIQSFAVHVPETAAGTVGAATAALTTTPDTTLGTLMCGTQNADFSFDCTVPVTTTPSAAGPRSATLSVSVPFAPTSGSPTTSVMEIGLGGTATGSVLAFDGATKTTGSTTTPIAPTTNSIFSTITPVGVALDGAGNVYTMDSHSGQFLESVQGTGSAALAGTLPTNPSQIAVDARGDVFAVGSGSANIVELAVSGAPASAGAPAAVTSTTVAYTPISGTAAPQAIAVDGAGNLFVADVQSTAANTAIYRLSLVANTLERQVTVGTGFTNPVSLAVDPSGNVYVADKGAGAVYKLTPGVVSGVQGYVQTTVSLPGVVPVAVATDAAGDLYVQDASSLTVIEVPVSGAQATVLTGLGHPTGLAVDGKGNVYSADSFASSITEVVRDAVAFNFGTGSAAAPTFAGTLTNVGNQPITGSNTVTNTTNFNVVGGTSNGCGFSSSLLGAQAAGNACTLVANFVGAGSGTVSDVVSYLPAATTIGTLTLTGTLQGTAVGTTTTISAPTPANPSYSSSATEVTFTVTVAPVSGTSPPTGTVAVTVDGTVTNPSLVASGSNGVATVTLTGLAAGAHTISAIYGTTGGFTGSNSGTAQSFSIAQDTTVASWTPGATTGQYSAPIGTAVLNAAATFGGSAVPGVFVYTANGVEVNAATYLAIGTYTLAATFYPTDAVDYSTSTASGGTFTVTKAATTAAVGATQMLVASDGTGNFSSVQAAVNALPATGGSVYIKPGTYNGFVTVVQPNVALRGLGGDPTKVLLTHEAGAFGSTYPYTGEFTAANESNGDQLPAGSTISTGDPGSATLYVARGINTAVGTTTSTPTNFYAENLSLINGYNTDTTTTTTTYETSANGTCTANAGPAMTYAALFNAQIQCASQALAIWTESDQSVMNNVYTASLQDTIYAGSISASGANPARQYWFRGKVTGAVDYIFGDAAAVFDHTSIYTAYHGTATGSETIEAQNQADQTGATPSYLSGYVMNSDVFTSQSSGMTNLYFGRPYGRYSTWITLNSAIDQVNPAGYIEFSGQTNLPTSTYAEYNNSAYTDPATGAPDANGVIYAGAGGSSGAGVFGTRETTSLDPGTPEAANAVKTALTQAQAQQYYPMAFLGATVPVSTFNTVTNWNPTAAIATNVNAFVPSGASATVTGGSSVTLVMRPQTPGLGAVTNGTYTIPTGTYTLTDSFNGSTTSLASGTLDASGEAYLTTSTLLAGTHKLTMSYGGDSNFSASTSTTPFILNVAAVGTTIPVISIQPQGSATYGTAASVAVTVNPNGSTKVPTGQVTLSVDSGAGVAGTLTATGTYTFSVPGLSAGSHSLLVLYGGDNNFSPTSQGSALVVAKSVLQVAANNVTLVAGQAVPAYTASITGFVNSDTQGSAVTGAPSLTTTPATPSAVGTYPIAASLGTLASSNYTFSFTSGSLRIQSATQAPAVATGDMRTVTEPVFPAVCTQLTAAITQVNDDIPASVDAVVTNPDGARIQAALNSCSGTGQAVQLSMDGAGHSAFLTGPLVMPSNVTLLVDPGVVLFFSRNAQDYDKVPGTHTCGTINASSATSSCASLIDIPKTSTNVGIMGFGKLDGRGGDTLINAIAPYQGFTWWGLSAAYTSPNSQQNPRWIQMEAGSSNITLYKITLRNAPLFHITTGGAVSNFTAWDIKIVTPSSSRNTDGIDPGNATNFTITRSWISDGDDDVAVGAAGTTAPAANISVTNNHFFAGHGQSIGSYTGAGVSNVLWDGNMASGNGYAGLGAAALTPNDGNSTGIRIKSENDRGGLVTNIQYSNGCLQYHPTEIQFTPLYGTNAGTLTPNFNHILMQNLVFMENGSTSGSVQFTGANNNGTVNPLQVTLDNVTFPSGLSASSFVNTGTAGTETNAQLTYGPGAVSANFISGFATFVGSNGDTATNNITATSLAPPTCSFTYLAPELTGPTGLPQTIAQGENATAVVILTPTVAGAPYPTGSVTLTDALTNNTTTAALTGTTDTLSVPLTGLAVGTHTFTATYSGDSNYPLTTGQTVYSTTSPYVITVVPGNLSGTTTAITGVPTSTAFGTSFTATATVTGSTPTGTVQFVVGGGGATGGYVYATAAVTSSTASATINLPYNATAYTVTAIYSGDAVNQGSTSVAAPVTITQGATTTTLSANTTTTKLGHPVALTATISSLAGTPTGTVNFSYALTSGGTQISLGSSILSGGTASASANLPLGTTYVMATYVASGSFAGSASTAMAIAVTAPTIAGLSSSPIALPYTMTTLAGGSGLAVPSSGNMACAGATDKYGDGCLATAISLTAADDLRAVVADPYGNVYFSDISAGLVRRITPNGVISNFAGRVTGTACVPTATVGCTPTLVSLSKPRGVGSDAAGDIFIADYSANQVFEVSASTGLMYHIAGTGTAGTLGDGGPAASAQVDAPRGAWGDSVGNVYIADTTANKIRVVDPTGNIHTFAGTGTASSTGDGGPATSATISNPQGVIVDVNLNVYLADSSGGKIRVVCVTCGTNSPLDALLAKLGIATPVNGNIYTVAGSGSTSAFAYTAPVLSTGVSMSPQKLAFDVSGNLYISDGNGFIWLLDFHTGYLRAAAANGTPCAGKTDNYGDGCPATQASFGDGGNGIGVGADTLGNIYISDTTNGLIRKVITGLASPSTATATTATRAIQLHFGAGDTPAASSAFAYTSSEWQLSAPMCSANGDTTTDCVLSASFTPAVPGARSTPLTVTSTAGNTANLALTGIGLGAGATLDPASQGSFGAGLQISGLATDTAGNVYVSDAASKNLLRFTPAAIAQGTSATGIVLTTLTAPGAVAVDPRGYVYVADTSTGLITQVSPAGTATTLAAKFAVASGLAVDTLNNLYVSDSSAQLVYQLSPITGAQRALAVGTLVAPAGLAVDPANNLLIADPGAGAVYRFNLQSGVTTTVTSPAVKPTAVVTDAAGNLLIADTGAVFAVPASANSAPFTVASITPTALAIDAAGNLYSSSGGSVLKLTRTHAQAQFASAASAPQTFSLLESGNQALALSSVGQTDATDYSLAATASTDCTLSGTLPASTVVGGVCSLTATYTPTTYIASTDTATFNGNLSNANLSTPASVQLVLSGPSAPPTPTIVLGAFSPALPVYGQTVTVSATVSGASVTPLGTVVFTIDSSTMSATPANGVATVSLTGLSVGTHTVSAAYTSSDGYASVSTLTGTLTVTQAAQAIVFTAPSSPVTFGVAPITLVASGGASGNAVVFSVVSGPGTIVGSTLTVTGAGTIQIGANQAGNTNYTAAAQVTQSVVVNPATQTIVFMAPSSPVTYGVAPITLVASGGASGNAIVFSVVSGPGTVSAGKLSVTGVGTIVIAANQAGNANYAAAAQVTQSVVVNKATPVVSVQSSLNPVLVQNAITLTATVSSTAGSPTGTVTFLDGTTVLGTGTLAGGLATLTTTTLAVGAHTITVAYSGDANFATATSPVLTETVDDFSLGLPTAGSSSLTVLPGGTATFTFTLSPVGATTFPAMVTLTLGGLPSGATYTFSPATIAAGAGTTTVTLTIQVAQTSLAAVHIKQDELAISGRGPSGLAQTATRPRHAGRILAPLALAFLLLPFAGRVRRAGRRLGRGMPLALVIFASLATIVGLTGCGATGSGFFAQAPQTYTLTVTGTSGALSRSTNVALTVE